MVRLIGVLVVLTGCGTEGGKAEVCDDGSSTSTWYIDKDGDGYGEEFVTEEACTQPDGYVADAADCDDDDANVNPDAEEICADNLDNDCDGGADSNDPDMVTQPWYLDLDDDTYGDPATEVVTGCPDEGYIDDGSDCDDGDPLINPDAVETCDGADNNCSGLVDDGGDCPCPVERFGDHAYLLCDSSVEWEDAQVNCSLYSYHMVAIGSAGENNWIKDQALAYALGGPWLGLEDFDVDGYYEWENGEPVVYENWKAGEPNSKSELCGEMGVNTSSTSSPGQWNDTDCSLTRRYICENLAD
jgi:hypothetical protein